jgi:hypothetical protein
VNFFSSALTDECPVGRRIIEAISWKLAAEFHRRHPEQITIIETHPGGGQYDCLTFVRGQEILGHLNRVGGFTPKTSKRSIQWESLWPRCGTNTGLGEILDEMSDGCGLKIPKKLPSTRPSSLGYRVMALLSASLAFESSKWQWRAGTEDTSGYACPDSRNEWFIRLSMDKELRFAQSMEKDGSQGRLRYWFLLKGDKPLCCISDEARYWNGRDPVVELYEKYKVHRNIFELAGLIQGQLS